ncbi:hypothetical protein DM02DRAFT_609988 [Periconia macrospinosa]|uniref:RNA methyltransferase n=1 Tax=Periconia macrospinosa TaxID=97972 RepID=A0A2V1E9U2_9PLEO|nr:hypothetical protein DM02DRAFT_609988 [Periconia macrospinosa]
MPSKSTNWGNYSDYHGPNHNYGSPPSIHVRDSRLALIDRLGISFKAKRCLDIGTNDGTISTQLAFDFGARHVVGVDIDPQLVSKAEDLLALRRSRLRPLANDGSHPDPQIDYFPMSAVLRHGHNPTPPTLFSSDRPSGVNFIAADWLLSTEPALDGPFDIILALNVIKWIHLEHLDDGLVAFFRKCQTSLASGGYLIIQLQTWESYEKAIRPNAAPHFAENLQKLQLRPDTSFAKLLQDEGLNLCASSSQLRRQINIYRKA